MLKKLVCCCILFIFFTDIFAQRNFNTDTLKVRVIGQADGIAQLNIKAIAKDDLNYLWLATEDGLHRYNSVDFKIYNNNPLDTLSIPEDHARDLYTANDTLFIASNSKGVFGLKLSNNTFFEISNNLEIPAENTSYKIFPVGNNYLLFSLRNSILLFNRKTKFIKTIPLPKNETENYVKSLYEVGKNNFIMATNATGLLHFNLNDFSVKNYDILDNSSHNSILSHQGLMYVGTENGLYIKNLKTKDTKQIINQDAINCFYLKDDTTILIGGDSGAYSYNTEDGKISKQVFIDQNKERHTPITINDILDDNKGNLWFATDGEGLIHYNEYREKFTTLKVKIASLSDSKKISTFQFLPYKDSTLFLGTTIGLIKYDFNQKKFHQYTNHKKELIYTIAKDDFGNVWAGGFTTGLLKYDAKEERFVEVKTSENYISNRDVIQITPHSKNELLVATWSGGLYIYNIQNNTFSNYYINGKPLNRARTSFIDSKKNLWLGTDEGVYKIEPNKTVTNFTNDAKEGYKISSDRIFGITENSKGDMWFGTSVGLTKLDVNTLKTTLYYKQKGLPNDFIYSILVTENDNIWVSTNFGLSLFDPATKTFTNYTQDDGLQNNEFNGKSGYKDANDTFYFGGIDGINIFKPKHLKTSPYEPKVHIESVELFNKETNKNELYKKTLEFKSNENVLTFNYAAINHLNSAKVDYAYFMEGFDDTWRPITKNKTITYTNLNPGQYVFKVKATNANGEWSSHQDAMQLTIIPPWYKTTLFKIVGFVLLLITSISFYYYKTYRLNLRNQELENLVAKRTTEVSLKNEALHNAYETSLSQKENIKFLMRELQHRVKNNLQIVSSLLNIQSQHIDNEIAQDALQVAKNRILAIANVEEKLKSDSENVNIKEFTISLTNSILGLLADQERLKFNIEYQVEPNHISGLNTTIYGLIINELLTNIAKHAYESYNETNVVVLSCKVENNMLILMINDNGKGYAENDISSFSMGLDLIKDMVFQIDGTLRVDSTRGTSNTIIIPLKN
ncbi:ligand-binding sensor domain-containing protein [Winogradskyella bathintestinalis]|uniref:Two-component regulator propeller domain-containing protein n=1 Tax=Winogradskyella bathintestinalis TaxID=3035208 RepID=A0ABT7ZSU3_9FLAO|nr:two-component regulator propeller domain-containing protein [Winogradskyella bathintestinalis]MDN3491889.1 two-component regulator propeller domain-containing protein [Winogradskyella bathintestinalis]